MTTPNYASKGTPIKSGVISKTLLTPCRRVGLARRTPGKSPLLSSTPPASSPIIKQDAKETSTPLTRKRQVKNRDEKQSSKKLKLEDEEEWIVEDKVEKRKPNDDKHQKNHVIEVAESDLAQQWQQKNQQARKGAENEDKALTNERHSDPKCANIKVHDSNNTKKKTPSKKKQKSETSKDKEKEIGQEPKVISPVPLKELNKSVITEDILNVKKKPIPFAKRLSLQRSTSYDDEELSDDDLPLATSLSQHLQRCISGVEKINTRYEEESDRSSPLLSKTSKRKLVLDSSDDEANDASKSDSLLSPKSLKDLQQSVKEKENRLAELKQAEVYKKIHNVEELQQLTTMWKIGCQVALRDLLVKLQEHGPMTMPMLMQKFNIGPKFLTYNPESDKFL